MHLFTTISGIGQYLQVIFGSNSRISSDFMKAKGISILYSDDNLHAAEDIFADALSDNFWPTCREFTFVS